MRSTTSEHLLFSTTRPFRKSNPSYKLLLLEGLNSKGLSFRNYYSAWLFFRRQILRWLNQTLETTPQDIRRLYFYRRKEKSNLNWGGQNHIVPELYRPSTALRASHVPKHSHTYRRK